MKVKVQFFWIDYLHMLLLLVTLGRYENAILGTKGRYNICLWLHKDFGLVNSGNIYFKSTMTKP